MKNDHREITSATVTVTITMRGLGIFGPGSLYSQALQAAKIRLEDRGFAVDKIQIDAIESVSVSGTAAKIEAVGSDTTSKPTCRQRLAAEGKPYPKSSCAICGAFSPAWKECDAAIRLEGIVNGLRKS